jgi:hypothetical protein
LKASSECPFTWARDEEKKEKKWLETCSNEITMKKALSIRAKKTASSGRQNELREHVKGSWGKMRKELQKMYGILCRWVEALDQSI